MNSSYDVSGTFVTYGVLIIDLDVQYIWISVQLICDIYSSKQYAIKIWTEIGFIAF